MRSARLLHFPRIYVGNPLTQSEEEEDEEDIMARESSLPAKDGEFWSTVTHERVLGAEETLLLAVLEQAVADLDDSSEDVRFDAERYIFRGRRYEGPFSFSSLCAHFGLSPDAVRQALSKRRGPRGRVRERRYRTAA